MTDPVPKEDRKKEASQAGVTIGVIAAFSTFGGYLTAFVHEYSFVCRFNIPAQFITLDWTTVLVAAIAVFLTSGFIVQNLFILHRAILAGHGAIARAGFKVALEYGAFVMPSYFLLDVWGGGWRAAGVPAFLMLVFILSEFALPYFYWEGQSYKERMKSAHICGSGNRTENILYGLVPKYILFPLIVVLWACALATLRGDSVARTQEEFLVVDTTPEAVVLRPYHDHLVCAYFDRQTKELSGEFFVLETAGGMETTLVADSVGPLRLPDK